MTTQDIADRYFEVRGCKIKRVYIDKKEAKKVAVKMNRKTTTGRLRAYSCDYCNGYHVGHIRPSLQDKIEAKRIDKVLKSHTVI